ncbi:MAG: dTDP-4-dehydrorhamnose reductase, partial [bacterium]|nr:dTDP-4-dehydrorhamnose reductase [bacterium]
MKIVVIGADGQLGFDLMRVFGGQAVGLTHKDIEVKDRTGVLKKISEIKPDVVINTAAIVKAEWCELNEEECLAVNAIGAGNVAEAAAVVGAVSVQISTDYVFDGSKESFSEDDRPNPLNVYGLSKLEGERSVQQNNPKHYIVRSGWFFGKHIPHKGLDFPRLMLKLAQEKPEVRVVNDQFGSPTYTKDLAEKIKEILERPAPFGIYHITNQGRVSWYDLAKKTFEFAGVKTPLIPISTGESGTKIKRPGCSLLV